MIVKPCLPYHGRVDQRSVIRMPDGISVFKTYYASIPGRPEPARTEWIGGAQSIMETERSLLNSAITGVGFITAFPHITKFFRFAPSVETVLHVRAFHTPGLRPLPLDREDGFTEFACLGEALIAADEYTAWAQAADVAAYLSSWSSWQDGEIRQADKLAAYVSKSLGATKTVTD